MIHTITICANPDHLQCRDIMRKYRISKYSHINAAMVGRSWVLSLSLFRLYGKAYLSATIDAVELLGGPNIKESDGPAIDRHIISLLSEMAGISDYVLTRIEYRYDYVCRNEFDTETYTAILEKQMQTYGWLKKNMLGKTLYYNNKAKGIRVYLKNLEREAKGVEPKEYEKDVLRYEVVYKNKYLSGQQRRYGTKRSLDNYLTRAEYHQAFQILLKIMYYGDYYRYGQAMAKIKSGIGKASDRKLLSSFFLSVARSSVDGAKNKYSYYKYTKAVRMLEDTDINPILINSKCKIEFLKNPLKNIFDEIKAARVII